VTGDDVCVEGARVDNIIAEVLHIGQHPVAEGAEKDRCNQKGGDGRVVELVVEHRWFLRRIGQGKALHHVEDKERGEADREEDRHACAEHEGHEDYIKHVGVLKVDDILWTAV